MPRSLALLLTFTVPASLLAAPVHAETRRAEKDGYRFEYSTQLAGGDRVLIKGRMLDDPEEFEFTVDPRGRVRGEVGSRSVLFWIGKEASERLLADLKSERALAQSGASLGLRLSE